MHHMKTVSMAILVITDSEVDVYVEFHVRFAYARNLRTSLKMTRNLDSPAVIILKEGIYEGIWLQLDARHIMDMRGAFVSVDEVLRIAEKISTLSPQCVHDMKMHDLLRLIGKRLY